MATGKKEYSLKHETSMQDTKFLKIKIKKKNQQTNNTKQNKKKKP